MDEKLKKLMSNGWSYRTYRGGGSYILTDDDIKNIAKKVSNDITEDGVLMNDKQTGETYGIYIKDNKLTMEKYHSEV